MEQRWATALFLIWRVRIRQYNCCSSRDADEAFYIPPKQEQAFNQGGTFLFDGVNTIFAHYDASTGAHSNIQEVIDMAKERRKLRETNVAL